MSDQQEEQHFNYKAFEDSALEQLRSGKPLEGKDGVLAPLIKRLIEASLSGELDAHLEESTVNNRRNGKMGKRVKTGFGTVDIDTPRDRNGSFEPQVLAKRQTVLGEALDHKVISMYGKGMSYSDICTHLEDLYGLLVSPASLSAITNRVLDDVKAWQCRTLESVYPIVWLDAIHYKVKEQGSIKTKAVYCVIGLNRDGVKDLLGLYIGESEGARFWLQVLTDIQNRGVKDIFIACIDNLKGFAEAIESIYPQTEVQLCIIHQIRNSTKFVAWKDLREVMADLKEVYQASTVDQAEKALLEMGLKWGKKYPMTIKSWNSNWDRLSQYFKYPKEIRKMIYTTNMIESFHSQLRKITKTKRVFHSDSSLLKLLYLVFINHRNGWINPVTGWKIMQAQIAIFFEDRFNQ
ncbi:IS256 family transposase [Pedobacter nototheniae]|uniref:IS256 family transposase n=1 Tax=Pedobacter nototheniae TaxID=2488994 RepID=UPI00103F51B7|nr:IS256 family transposase [Pedobacter nototheniae]